MLRGEDSQRPSRRTRSCWSPSRSWTGVDTEGKEPDDRTALLPWIILALTYVGWRWAECGTAHGPARTSPSLGHPHDGTGD